MKRQLRKAANVSGYYMETSPIMGLKLVHCLFSVVLLMTISCTSKPNHRTKSSSDKDVQSSVRASCVMSFKYGGYGDYVFSVIEGQIFRIDSKDSLIQLGDCNIVSYDMVKREVCQTIHADSTGQFKLEFPSGKFGFVISKAGFESLKIYNFDSDPDQISTIEILMQAGEKSQGYCLPEKQE